MLQRLYCQQQSRHPQIKGEIGHHSDPLLSPIPLKRSGCVNLQVYSRMSQKQLFQNSNFSATPVEMLQNKGESLWHTCSGECPTTTKPSVRSWQSLIFARTSKGGNYMKCLYVIWVWFCHFCSHPEKLLWCSFPDCACQFLRGWG